MLISPLFSLQGFPHGLCPISASGLCAVSMFLYPQSLTNPMIKRWQLEHSQGGLICTSISLPRSIDIILGGPSRRGRSARSPMVRQGRIRATPVGRTYSTRCRNHVPADAYGTTASGVPVANFRRSRPKTSLSRPQVLYILLELDRTAWFSTAL
jgi:hypothetical protein